MSVQLKPPPHRRIRRALDALFREARLLERRRRRRYAMVALLACGAVAGIVFGFVGGGVSTPSVRGSAHPAPSALNRARSLVTGDFSTAFIALVFSPIAGESIWAGNGGVIERSDDGGVRWRNITPANLVGDDPGVRIAGVASFGASDLWFAATEAGTPQGVRGFAIDRSTDGGRTWESTGVPGCEPIAGAPRPTGCASMSFSFVTPRRGWALGSNGNLYRTTDGGAHWSPIAKPPGAESAPPAALDFSSETTAWLTAGRSLYTSHDGGQHWQKVPLPKAGPIRARPARLGAPHFVDSRDGIIPAAMSSRGAVIYETSDGGRQWTSEPLPVPLALGGPNWAPPALVTASRSLWSTTSGEYLFVTANGGRSWTRVPTPPTYALGVQPIWGSAMATPLTGWIDAVVDRCGPSGPTRRNRNCNLPMLLRTTDGGRDWHIIHAPTS